MPELDPRGRYDRALTARQRAERRRLIILDGCARALLRYGPVELTVSRILETASVGRNSLYETFPDAAAAARATPRYALDRLLAKLDEHVSRARTPHARVRALVLGWSDIAAAEPHLARCLGRDVGAPDEADAHVAALSGRVQALWRQAYQDGATGCRPNADRAWHLAEAIAAAGARAALGRDLRRRSEALVLLVEAALR